MSKKKFKVPCLKTNFEDNNPVSFSWYSDSVSINTVSEIISILKKQQYQIDTIVNGLKNIIKKDECYLEKLSKSNIDAIKLLLEKE
jgi:hypothetical protein